MKKKARQLKALQNEACRKCTLWLSSEHVCILGRGNLEAPIMLLGEAPGASEAATGKPFMGKSGRLLNKVLEELKLFSLCYISNIVRCKPPQNRNPFDNEIKACSYYLQEELRIVQPSILVLLGRTAIKGMGYGKEVRPRQGHFRDDENRIVKPTYHPSYCLRNGKVGEKLFRRELKEVKLLYERYFK